VRPSFVSKFQDCFHFFGVSLSRAIRASTGVGRFRLQPWTNDGWRGGAWGVGALMGSKVGSPRPALILDKGATLKGTGAIKQGLRLVGTGLPVVRRVTFSPNAGVEIITINTPLFTKLVKVDVGACVFDRGGFRFHRFGVWWVPLSLLPAWNGRTFGPATLPHRGRVSVPLRHNRRGKLLQRQYWLNEYRIICYRLSMG